MTVAEVCVKRPVFAMMLIGFLLVLPIPMTTFSIVGGLIPTAIGIGAGSAQRSAIAVTIVGGQMLCLLPTLLLAPRGVFSDRRAFPKPRLPLGPSSVRERLPLRRLCLTRRCFRRHHAIQP